MPDRTTTGIIIVIIVVRAQDGYYQTARYDDTKGRGYFAAAAILVHNSNDDIFWNMDSPLCLHNGQHETKNAFFGMFCCNYFISNYKEEKHIRPENL